MAGSIQNIIHPTYYADTIDGSVNPLSGLLDPNGQPVPVGVACYVANGDGAGNPVVWTCAVSTASVDHSTVEAVAGATGCRWLKTGAWGGGGGGGGTITTGVGLSGDGSVGNPARLAAGTLVNPGTDQTSIAVNTLTGSEGGIEIEGLWVTTGAADKDLILQLNSITTGYTTADMHTTGGNAVNTNMTGTIGASPITNGVAVGRAGGAAGRDRLKFRIKILPVAGTTPTYVTTHSLAYASASGNAFETFIEDAVVILGGALTGFTFTTADATASALKAGTQFAWRPLGFTAAV